MVGNFFFCLLTYLMQSFSGEKSANAQRGKENMAGGAKDGEDEDPGGRRGGFLSGGHLYQ